jgi:predicted metalloprotease
MKMAFSTGSVAVVLAGMLGAGGADESSSRAFRESPGPEPVRVTARDVDASNEKVRMAYGALSDMWTAHFDRIGERFSIPRIARYRAAFRGACGVVGAGNAAYCPRDNSIAYDDVFVAALAKRASTELGTDGDMAGLGVIAHEVGHAVAIQLGYRSRYTYQDEAVADCLAGAFTEQSKRDGHLEPGDIEEAFYGMAAAGDPTPRLTGDGRTDRVILTRAKLMGHGTKEQRMSNFRAGLENGAGACLEDFRGRSASAR